MQDEKLYTESLIERESLRKGVKSWTWNHWPNIQEQRETKRKRKCEEKTNYLIAGQRVRDILGHVA
jgi:hypothetical protein